MIWLLSRFLRIEKELDKELQEEEKKNELAAKNPPGAGDGGTLVESSAVKPTVKGIREKARAMPKHIRSVHAQHEKEKGNEVSSTSDHMVVKFRNQI